MLFSSGVVLELAMVLWVRVDSSLAMLLSPSMAASLLCSTLTPRTDQQDTAAVYQLEVNLATQEIFERKYLTHKSSL